MPLRIRRGGAWAITSREIDVMMGMMVTAQINPQAKIDCTYWGVGLKVRKMGTNPAWSTSHLAGAACRPDTRRRPQKPYTMLGTVASRSTTAVSTGLSRRGPYSLIINAVDNEIGAAIATPSKAMATEPTSKGSIPNCPASGFHALSVNSPNPACRRAGNPYQQRKPTRPASNNSTVALLPARIPLKALSAPTGLISRSRGTSS